MLTLYDYLSSGNGYKVRLALAHLGIPYRYVEVDILAGGTRTPEFLAKNANGKIPLLELDDGRCLAESNAILCYLAEGSELLPAERFARAETLQWLFFEQYSHEPCIAVARFICHLLAPGNPREAELPKLRERGHAALAVMEQHLQRQPFFGNATFTVADIALYAYTHVAEEGGIELTPYPAIRNWLSRVAAMPGHVTITTA